MEKIAIKNRKQQKLVILLERAEKQKGLAFVMHGLGGNKNEAHIAAFAKAFKEKGFTIVRFDTTNTFGESDGIYENATTTNYYEDLEDVVAWAETQNWYEEPFYLCGHSTGGLCIALYAQKYPKKVKGLAPIATVISGTFLAQSPWVKDRVNEWKETGWLIEASKSVPGRIKRLRWAYMDDCLKIDLLKNVDRLTMPVLLIVGDTDEAIPLAQQHVFFDRLPAEKELHILKNTAHILSTKDQLTEVTQILSQWIDKTLQ